MGIAVDEELKFNKHAQIAVAKASKTLSIIKHIVCRRSSKVMTNLYKGFVQSLIEFGMCVATPLNNGNQQKIECVQKQPTKAVDGCKNLDYPSQLYKLKFPTLLYRP